MPYLIYPPSEHPYVLDDEDSQFLQYFSAWGWRYEQRPPIDPEIIETIEYDTKSRRPSLYNVWESQCKRRIHTEDKRLAAQAKEIKAAKKQAVEEKGLREKVSSLFHGKKEGKKDKLEKQGYKNGTYVNHLEDLQKKWVGEDGEGGG